MLNRANQEWPEQETYKTEHYDYEKQAWVGVDGCYLSCAHPSTMNCNCYGRIHAGELAAVTRG